MKPRWRPKGGKKLKNITKSFCNVFTNIDILHMYECVSEYVSGISDADNSLKMNWGEGWNLVKHVMQVSYMKLRWSWRGK